MTVEDLDADLRRELGLPANAKGVVVSRVSPDGPADLAGLQRGDVVVEVDQKPVTSTQAFNSFFREKRVYLLRFRRSDGLAITSLDLSGGKKPEAAPSEDDDQE
jgi:S1-C subfamily serine protease